MSHLTTAPAKCLNIDDLRAAAKHFGGELIEAKTFESYQRNQPCLYAIKLPGVRYQVGVRKAAEGHFTLHYDPFEADWGPRPEDKHDGGRLVAKFGTGLQKLTQQYAVHTVMRSARAKGVMCQQRTLSDGSIRLCLINA